MVRSTHKNRPLTIRLSHCYSSTISNCTFVERGDRYKPVSGMGQVSRECFASQSERNVLLTPHHGGTGESLSPKYHRKIRRRPSQREGRR